MLGSKETPPWKDEWRTHKKKWDVDQNKKASWGAGVAFPSCRWVGKRKATLWKATSRRTESLLCQGVRTCQTNK